MKSGFKRPGGSSAMVYDSYVRYCEKEKRYAENEKLQSCSELCAKPEIINSSLEFVAVFGFQRRKNPIGTWRKILELLTVREFTKLAMVSLASLRGTGECDRPHMST